MSFIFAVLVYGIFVLLYIFFPDSSTHLEKQLKNENIKFVFIQKQEVKQPPKKIIKHTKVIKKKAIQNTFLLKTPKGVFIDDFELKLTMVYVLD